MTEPTKEDFEIAKKWCLHCTLGGIVSKPGVCQEVATALAQLRSDTERKTADRIAELEGALQKVERFAFKASGDEFLMWAQEALHRGS